MDIKKLLSQHILTILCVASLLVLLLPFLSVTAEMEILGQSSSSSATTTGYGAVGNVFLGWGLIIGPALLVAMNYIKQLEKYKGLLAIVVPIACIVIEIITFFQAKGASASASAGGGIASAEVNAKMGIGFFLLILVYLGMIVSGAVLYHNFTLDKQGLARLKTEGADLLGNGFDKLKGSGANIINSASEKFSNFQSNSGELDNAEKVQKKSVNHNKSEEILHLIEKLASMKEKGILTEEEFTVKKRELLEEI